MKISRRQLLIGLAVVPVAVLPFSEALAAPSLFPKGTVMMFQQTTPPSGWHELTVAEMPSHTHGCVHGFVIGVHGHNLDSACPKCGPRIIARKV